MDKKDIMDGIKVIFLDVDGVLNSDRTTRKTKTGYLFVSSSRIKNLKKIINETGSKIVLSSTWRYERDEPKYNPDFLELKQELLRYGIKFYGFTPVLPTFHRGLEINQWLSEHTEVSNFVILDDENIKPNESHWVKTSMSKGLGKEETEQAIKILNGGDL